MNTRLGKSFGLAFVVAVGILAVMFALGTFSSQQVGADTRTSPETHNTVSEIDTELTFSTRAASAPVEIRIRGTAPATAIPAGDVFTVRLKNFTVPSSIGRGDVSIQPSTAGNLIDAGAVTVSGTTLRIEIGDTNPDPADVDGIAANANYEVRIRQSAGVTNPAIAGSYHVDIDDTDDATDNFDAHHVRIDRSRKLSASSGVSGSTVTVSGTGYSTDISAIYIESAMWDAVGKVTYRWSGGRQYAKWNETDGNQEAITLDGTESAFDEALANRDLDGTGGATDLTEAEAFLAAIGMDDDLTNDLFDDNTGIRPADGTVYGVVFSNYVVEFWRFNRVPADDQDNDAIAAADIVTQLNVGQSSDDEVLGAQPDVGSDGKFSQAVTVGDKFSAGKNPIFIQDTAGVVEFVGNYNVGPSISLSKDAAQLGEQLTITFNHFTQVTPVKVTLGGDVLLNSEGDAVISGIDRNAPGNSKKISVPNTGLETGGPPVEGGGRRRN